MNHESDEEVDFNDFIDRMFFEDPMEPNSICINCDKSNINELFNKLLRIFTEGVRIMGHDSSIQQTGDILYNFTPNDVIKLQRYFNSLGYKINYKITHRNIVLKLRAFILNSKKCIFKDNDIQNYKNIYPSQIFVSDLINQSTIQTKNLTDKKTFFSSKDLYFFLNFEAL